MEGNEESREKPSSSAKKRMVLKILVALAVIVILLVVFLSSTPADPYDTVDKLMSNPEKYVDKYVEVRGRVERWSPPDSSFNLTGKSYSVAVDYSVLPDQFANGKDVVVKGDFLSDGHSYWIMANDIIVGCASRY